MQVFWEGTDGHLWHEARGLGKSWSGPQNLGMDRLGGAPHAVALPGGEVDVFWRGSTKPHSIWSAMLRPGRRTLGPARVGGTISGQPWPVASGGHERVLFRGTDGRLWLVQRSDGGHWAAAVRARGTGQVKASPVVAAGPQTVPLQVFWTNSRRRLVTAQLAVGGGLSRPLNLGGSVTQATGSS